MNAVLVIGGFLIIAVMRVIQKICGKTSSRLISDDCTFFKYGAVYQFFAAAFAVITLFIVGFYGFNLKTFICAIISAILFGIDLYTSIESIKGCSLVVANIFSNGGLVISVIVSFFWFGEGVSAFQIAGLLLFFVAVYLLSVTKKEETEKKISLKTFILLIINFACNGAVMVTQKYFSKMVENGNTAVFSFLTFALCSIIMIVFYAVARSKQKPVTMSDDSVKKPFLDKRLWICAALLALGIFAINYLITEMGKIVDSVILFPVSSALSIIITIIVGRVVYKEKLNAFGVIGVIAGIISIITLSVFTPETVSRLFG